MFIWDFVLGDIMDQFIDWVYAQLVGFFGNFSPKWAIWALNCLK